MINMAELAISTLEVGIDVGYYNTKVVYNVGKQECKVGFLSTIKEGIQQVDNDGEIKVEYNGKAYTVGSVDGEFSTEISRLEDPNFPIFFFTSIAKVMENLNLNTITVNICTGLPINQWESHRKKLRLLIKENPSVEIVLNGKIKNITIGKVKVYPQAACYFLLNPEKFKGDAFCIDLGGKTVDVGFFHDTNLLKKEEFIDKGMLHFYSMVGDIYKSITGNNLPYPVKAIEIIEKGYVFWRGKTTDVTEQIKEAKAKYVDELLTTIIGKFDKNKWGSSENLLFLGGGMIHIEEVLKSESVGLDYAHIDSDIYFNARIFHRIAKQDA